MRIRLSILCLTIPYILLAQISANSSEYLSDKVISKPDTTNPKYNKMVDLDGRGKWFRIENSNMSPDYFKNNFRRLLGLSEQDSISMTQSKNLIDGGIRYTFQQYKNGIKVENGYCYVYINNELIIQIINNFNYHPYYDNGEIINGGNIDNLLSMFTYNLNLNIDKIQNTELVLYPVKMKNSDSTTLIRCIKFDIIYGAMIDKDTRLIINTKTKEIINSFSLIKSCNPTGGLTAKTIFNNSKTIYTEKEIISQKYYLQNDCEFNPSIPKIETKKYISNFNSDNYYSTDGTWTTYEQKNGAQSHWSAERACTYFGFIWRRNDSYKFGGIPLINRGTLNIKNYNSTAYENSSCNSFWRYIDNTIYLGECDLSDSTDNYNTLDIVGHEFTHAIIDYESNLIYQGESGALNESFSDIFGEAIEMWTNGGVCDWIHGGEKTTSNTSKRNFMNPKIGGVHNCSGEIGQPNTYNSGPFWYPTNGSCDYGGVHINSGVQNYWFYLITNGGSGTNDNGYTYNIPNGIGFNKAIGIAYRMMTEKLGPTSNYGDSRIASLEVARELYGQNSFEYNIVEQAWCAVGMGDNCSNNSFPDLIPINAQVSNSIIPAGGTAMASCQNKNQGLRNANSSYTAIWLSQNQTYEGSPTDINLNADLIVPALNSGQNSNTLSKQITIPANTPSGTWYIMFGADALESINEGTSGESNNQVFIPVTITNTSTCNSPNFNITPSTSWQTHSSSHSSNDFKIYRIAVTIGNVYRFKTGCGNGATANYDTYLELFNNNCSLIRSNDDSCSYGLSYISWTANYSGYVYLKVRGFGGSGGNYTLAYRYHTCAGWNTVPTSKNFTSNGGSGSFTVYTSEGGCAYSAISNNSWINNITYSGGTVYYNVDANSNTARSGSISVKNISNNTEATFTITQNAGNSCTNCPAYDNTISPISDWTNISSSHGINGCKIYRIYVQSGYIYYFKTGCSDGASADYDTYIELLNNGCSVITSNDDGCESLRSSISWTASYTGYAYLKIRGYNGVGGNFTLAYKYNTCSNWTTTPSSASFSSISNYGTFEVKTQFGGCTFYATSNNNWINDISYPGNGIVEYHVDYNTESAREGTISIKDENNITQQIFTVNQDAGSICTSCPAYDKELSPTSSWKTEIASHGEFGCKLYRVPVTTGKTYTFKTGCGDGATSDYDTYMALYDNSCNVIITDDDGCPSTSQSYITWAATFNGYVYIKVMGYYNNYGNYTLAYSYNSCSTPLQPGSISGNNTACENTVQTYRINPVAGATEYYWSLPAGWSGNSSTNSITATSGDTGGTISVSANNSCGTSPARTMTVSVTKIPNKPGNISGNITVCQNSPQIYSVNPVTNATKYNWQLPSGWGGSSNTNSITTDPGNTGGAIFVSAENLCGISLQQTMQVATNPLPYSSSSISGTTNTCIDSTVTYSINATNNALNYLWTYPAGWTINWGQDSNVINLKIGANSGQICVTPFNNCGNGNQVCKFVSVNRMPGTTQINGSNTPVINSNVNYTASAAGAINYLWTIPNGWVINSGQGTNSINVHVGGTLGDICAKPSSICGSGTEGCLTVNIITGIITGTYKSDISIIPNPNNGQFLIKCEGLKGTNVELSIYNTIGQIAHSEKISKNNSEKIDKAIDLRSLPRGVYYLQLKSGEEIATQKFTITE